MPNPENTGGRKERTPAEDLTLAKEKFQDYVRSHHKFTLETLSGESATPHLLVVTRNTETLEDDLVICCLDVPFNEAEEKQKTMFAMGLKFYEEQMIVLAVIMSSECWMAKRNTEADWQDVQPRHDPLKQEGIMVAGAGVDPGQRMLIMTRVKRDEKNNIVVDGEPDEMIDGGGRFFLLDYFWRGYFSKVKRP